jgi:hypothetical protein
LYRGDKLSVQIADAGSNIKPDDVPTDPDIEE